NAPYAEVWTDPSTQNPYPDACMHGNETSLQDTPPIAPGANCVIRFSFFPTDAKSSSATAQIHYSSNGGSNLGSANIALSGAGIAVNAAFSRTSIPFGSVNTLGVKVATVTVTNKSTLPLLIEHGPITQAAPVFQDAHQDAAGNPIVKDCDGYPDGDLII